MLLAGHPTGTYGLDSYDAACVALASIYERRGRYPEVFSFKEADNVLKELQIGTARDSDLDALAAMRAEMSGNSDPSAARLPPPRSLGPARSADPAADMMAMRAQLGKGTPEIDPAAD